MSPYIGGGSVIKGLVSSDHRLKFTDPLTVSNSFTALGGDVLKIFFVWRKGGKEL